MASDGLTAISQPITDDLKALAEAVVHRDKEVGAMLLEIEEQGRFSYSASACTSSPLSSTRSINSLRAWISLPLTVAKVFWTMATPKLFGYRLT